jgi:hypothetical protein
LVRWADVVGGRDDGATAEVFGLTFLDVSVRHGVTWSSLIPFCVKALMAYEVPANHTYRFWGPAVRLPDIENALGIQTIGWWGMTETITQGIVGDLDHPGDPLSIGRASPAYEISVRRHSSGAGGAGRAVYPWRSRSKPVQGVLQEPEGNS